MGVSYSSALPQPVRAHRLAPAGGRVYSNPGPLPALLRTNSFEGGSNGTGITTGNSGGTSGNAFSTSNASGAITYSNTEYAHGGLGAKFVTTGVAVQDWVAWTFFNPQPKLWFRFYAYVPAYPAAALAVLLMTQLSASVTTCRINLNTNGTLAALDNPSNTIFTTTNAVPLNQWFRVEGFVVGSSNQGQMSLQLFYPADSQTPIESRTGSAATLGTISSCRYGVTLGVANVTLWMDDVGLSNTGPLGPASLTGPASLGYPVRASIGSVGLPPHGRVASNKGALVRNPTPGPVFRQTVQPARARIPQRPRAGGLVAANQHTPPYVPPNPPPPAPVAPALDASPLPSLITTFPGTT